MYPPCVPQDVLTPICIHLYSKISKNLSHQTFALVVKTFWANFSFFINYPHVSSELIIMALKYKRLTFKAIKISNIWDHWKTWLRYMPANRRSGNIGSLFSCGFNSPVSLGPRRCYLMLEFTLKLWLPKFYVVCSEAQASSH